jgi:type II secretory pathway pseudopilin PulG
MDKTQFPTLTKLRTVILLIIIIVLSSFALFLGTQMVEIQRKVTDLQNQVTHYQNFTDALQNQAASLRTQVNNLQNPNKNVTLTITSIGTWYPDPIGGYPYNKQINVTLKNYGSTTIGGMTLDFTVAGNNTDIGYYRIYVDSNIGVLHVLESKSMTVRLIVPTVQGTQVLENCRLTIILMFDEDVLDETTVRIGG